MFLKFIVLVLFLLRHCQAWPDHHHFFVKEAPYTRLCSTKNILTVNGQFPGPTLRVRSGETIYVTVHNKGSDNISIHWHGVKMPRNPWSDGPSYITQCPIQPGRKFTQKIILSTEEGTLWWHAHNDWFRATVYGAIFVYPKYLDRLPFPLPHADVPIILGEWWKEDIRTVLRTMIETGLGPNISDALTVNGQPGDLYPCSKTDTFNLNVDHGKTYLLRIVNAALNTMMFFTIRRHKLVVVGTDGSYTKPLKTKYIVIGPGQTIDTLLHANQRPDTYYMAARAYSSAINVSFINTTTTATLRYNSGKPSPSSPRLLPFLPYYNETRKAFKFIRRLKSLNNPNHPIHVPLNISTPLFSTVSLNRLMCPTSDPCDGPNGTRLAASLNNISFVTPSISILEAYVRRIPRVFGDKFPRFPPLEFDYTARNLPSIFETPKRSTQVIFVEYGATIELVLQGTNLVSAIDHPIHLHGYEFYVVGYGFGNFDKDKDPLRYNLEDPPYQNTVMVPKNGWATIRFKANNPGVWFMHCHLERHMTWGMDTVFIVKDGKGRREHVLPPPPDMPPC